MKARYLSELSNILCVFMKYLTDHGHKYNVYFSTVVLVYEEVFENHWLWQRN